MTLTGSFIVVSPETLKYWVGVQRGQSSYLTWLYKSLKSGSGTKISDEK